MKTQAGDASQAKIKVRLEIVPEEEKSASDKTLAQAIATDIANSNCFDQDEVEVPYEGKQGVIPPEFWIWIAIGVAYVGKDLRMHSLPKRLRKQLRR